ncbi:MAG: YgiQ family radical SAM protein [Thermodesulfobacteriota bacterium]
MTSDHRTNIPGPTFLPTTPAEVRRLGWSGLDAILVTGDTYIDAPHIGVAVIGRVLLDAGFRVGIIAQPDTASDTDITRLGEPALFWGVTGGCVDSMVANFTASGKRRKSDDMTPGGQNTRRPDRAVIHYTNLIRRYFKGTRPIILGGIEASLRRISHYDAWADAVRRSILFDAKADILVYGMGEATLVELARRLKEQRPIESIRGICYIRREIPEPSTEFPVPDIELPPHDAVVSDKDAFIRMFRTFYDHADPITAARLIQKQDTRYLVQNPPAFPPSPETLDRVHELPYVRDVHPFYKKSGRVAALDTIRFSLATHRGCYGECRFCAISVHQGRRVVSRSRDSILREAAGFAAHPEFKGVIPDVGGPTANMYGADCDRKAKKGACPEKGCLFPETCKRLPVHHGQQIALLRALRNLDGVRKVFIGSGIRYDLILADQKAGEAYLQEILRHHVSGQLKIAPEHISDPVLDLMGKPGRERLEAFLRLFASCNRKAPRKSFLTYYLMAAHPGCTQADMAQLRAYALQKLGMLPEQVQIFTPTPSTFATLMYHTEKDPFSGKKIFVEKQVSGKLKQKGVMAGPRRPKRRAG